MPDRIEVAESKESLFMPMLMIGDQFPDLKLALPQDESITLPGDLGDSWAYIFFYRGSW